MNHIYLIVLLLVLTIGHCQGAIKTWVGPPEENDWSVPSNWNPASTPTSVDDVRILDENNNTVVFSFESDVEFGSIILGSSTGPYTNGTLLFLGGFTTLGKINISSASLMYMGSFVDQTPYSYYTANLISVDKEAGLLIGNATVISQIYNYGSVLLDGRGLVAFIENSANIIFEENASYKSISFNNRNGSVELKAGVVLDLYGIENGDYSSFQKGSNLYASKGASLGIINETFYLAESNLDFNQASIYAHGVYMLIGHHSHFNMTGTYTNYDGDGGDSQFNAFESNATIVNATVHFNHSAFYLSDSQFNIFGTSDIYMIDSYILTLGTGGYLNIFGETIMRAYHSNITIDRILLLDENAKLYLSDSDLYVFGSSTTLAIATAGDSRLYLNDHSDLIVDGLFYMTNSSKVSSNLGQFFIQGYMVMQHFSMVELEDTECYLTGLIVLYDSSEMFFNNTYLYVNGSVGAFDNSTLNIDRSTLSIPGNLTLTSKFLSTDSIINVDEYFQSLGVYIGLNTDISVSGQFQSIGITIWQQTSLICNGTAKFDSQFFGEHVNITVQSGDLVFLENSNFTCTNCTISVLSGVFEYQQGTRLELFNTTLTNNGTVSSLGDVSLSPGSSITNTGLFTILSNIIANATTNNQTNHAEINNSGSINSQSNVTIDVLINNSGNFSIESNSSIYVQEFTQTDGGNLQLVGGGSITSYLNLNIRGGSVYGNGAINTSLDLNNNGQLGIKNRTSALEIYGNLTQSRNTTTVIRINTIDDFTKYKIIQSMELAGTLLVYMNKNLLGNDVNVTIISYNQTSSSGGDFGKIKVLTYDPENNDDEEEVECQAQPTKGGKNYSLLLQDCVSITSQNNRNKVIVGAVVGSIVGASVLVASYITYKKYLAKKLFQKKLNSLQVKMDANINSGLWIIGEYYSNNKRIE
ncbi:hypothetical protein DFA_04648 [Cavenderia fasciculata]|uniref:Transmembrane protein n=1 Tax=Cavenderia fasciculata TaxID=261658 RepID=F4PQ57_CACFS|nr:uncharacterized protein DFA_04648 [Cavenderia fasciculata]EGG22520.1 hypothetical protein DFA_04648 [Cavenderia fasciculata]|eukprot:XP_004360371.1 hypothetical protein DFA_04648 [Cavenderia fasciculata]